MGSVDRLLISEDLRSDVVVYECPNGHEEYEVVVDSRHSTPSHECSECGEEADVDEREDVIEHLMSIAEQRGTDTKFISTDFEKGEQLLDAFGGIARVFCATRRASDRTRRKGVFSRLLLRLDGRRRDLQTRAGVRLGVEAVRTPPAADQ